MVPEVEIKEHVGRQSMDTEKEDGWVEVQKLVLQPTPSKYIPKFHYP